jgi:hypothetical protein
VTEIDRILDN